MLFNTDKYIPLKQTAFTQEDEFDEVSLDDDVLKNKRPSPIIQFVSDGIASVRTTLSFLTKEKNTYDIKRYLEVNETPLPFAAFPSCKKDDFTSRQNLETEVDVSPSKDENPAILSALQEILKHAGEMNFLSNLLSLLSASTTQQSNRSLRKNKFLMNVLFPDQLRENGNFKFEMDGKSFLKCVAEDAENLEIKEFLNNPKVEPNRPITQQWMKVHALTAQQMEDVIKPILLPHHMKKEEKIALSSSGTEQQSQLSSSPSREAPEPTTRPDAVSKLMSMPQFAEQLPSVQAASSMSPSLVFQLLNSFVNSITGLFKKLFASSFSSHRAGEQAAQPQQTFPQPK